MFWIVALPSPNTEKNHPKWDMGKDFSSQAFIEIKKVKIRVQTLTTNEYAGERGIYKELISKNEK